MGTSSVSGKCSTKFSTREETGQTISGKSSAKKSDLEMCLSFDKDQIESSEEGGT
jgi:hypothetical protein